MKKSYLAGIAVLAVLAIIVAGILIGRSSDEPRTASGDATGDAGTGVAGGPVSPAPPVQVAPDAVVKDDVVYTPRDVEIFEETVAWARQESLDTLGIGAMMTRIGRRFVGDPYTPHLLDPPGPERLVVNLREFDCVTYVESVLALARVIREGTPTFPQFTEELRRIRYRGGTMDGYMSRLHYFSEWIHDNAEKGLVRNVTSELGGAAVTEPVNFMSTHSEAYVHLDGNAQRIAEIREIERRLSSRSRAFIPQDRIDDLAEGIRDGDVIAATSTVDGLDIAHTGLALWIDGRLHLMHAPLVGKSVEISTRPLAARIVRIDGQDGIMVARPL